MPVGALDVGGALGTGPPGDGAAGGGAAADRRRAGAAVLDGATILLADGRGADSTGALTSVSSADAATAGASDGAGAADGGDGADGGCPADAVAGGGGAADGGAAAEGGCADGICLPDRAPIPAPPAGGLLGASRASGS